MRNVELNGLTNVVTNRAGLWDKAGSLHLSGEPALSTTAEASASTAAGETVPAIAADDYLARHGIPDIGLLMLDTEGGEEKALRGARRLLGRAAGRAPDLVFEVHRHHVDWSNGLERTPILSFLFDLGYRVYAVRDFHDNVATAGLPLEMIPADKMYLEGPPHGFNMYATKEPASLATLGVRLVENVSPKLLPGRDPALHTPLARPA